VSVCTRCLLPCVLPLCVHEFFFAPRSCVSQAMSTDKEVIRMRALFFLSSLSSVCSKRWKLDYQPPPLLVQRRVPGVATPKLQFHGPRERSSVAPITLVLCPCPLCCCHCVLTCLFATFAHLFKGKAEGSTQLLRRRTGTLYALFIQLIRFIHICPARPTHISLNLLAHFHDS
jgi:hypothetical protein